MRKRYSYEYPAPYRNIQRLIWFYTYKLSVNSHIKEIACNHNGTFLFRLFRPLFRRRTATIAESLTGGKDQSQPQYRNPCACAGIQVQCAYFRLYQIYYATLYPLALLLPYTDFNSTLHLLIEKTVIRAWHVW